MKSPISVAQTATETVVGTKILPVTGLVRSSLGMSTFRLSLVRSGLTHCLSVKVLPATSIFMAPIHLRPSGANGPVLFWLCGHPALAPQNSPVPAIQFPMNNAVHRSHIWHAISCQLYSKSCTERR